MSVHTSTLSQTKTNICDRPREKMTQVGKINFKVRLSTALMANFVDFPGGFYSLGAENILESNYLLEKR